MAPKMASLDLTIRDASTSLRMKGSFLPLRLRRVEQYPKANTRAQAGRLRYKTGEEIERFFIFWHCMNDFTFQCTLYRSGDTTTQPKLKMFQSKGDLSSSQYTSKDPINHSSPPE